MKTTGHNSIYKIGRVSFSKDSFMDTESSVIRINICADKPIHRKSENLISKP